VNTTPRDRDFAFVRRRWWLVGHVVALAAVVLFVNLGLWQLRRHDQRSTLNTRIEERLEAAPVPLGDILTGALDLSDLEYRRVVVTGRFDTAEEVILQNRSLKGISGHHVLTPLVLGDGTAVIVDRGWVPIDVAGPPVPEAAPPEGTVGVTGIVRLTQTRGSFGPVDPPTGVLDRISRVDVERLRLQSDRNLAPVYVILETQEPEQLELPLALPPPDVDAGPHLSYAVQWFVFAGVVVIGYPILLIRTATRKRGHGRRGARAPESERAEAST
jgi:surfeit locus 1 family protein